MTTHAESFDFSTLTCGQVVYVKGTIVQSLAAKFFSALTDTEYVSSRDLIAANFGKTSQISIQEVCDMIIAYNKLKAAKVAALSKATTKASADAAILRAAEVPAVEIAEATTVMATVVAPSFNS